MTEPRQIVAANWADIEARMLARQAELDALPPEERERVIAEQARKNAEIIAGMRGTSGLAMINVRPGCSLGKTTVTGRFVHSPATGCNQSSIPREEK